MNLHFAPIRGTESKSYLPDPSRIRKGLGLLTLTLALVPACGESESERPAFYQDDTDANGTSSSDKAATATSCTDGATRSCQITLGQTDTHVSCFRGTQTCNNEKWGACEMGTVSTELRANVARSTDTAPSKSVLSFSSTQNCSGAYTNACDPQCQFFQEAPGGIQVSATSSHGGAQIDGPLCYFNLYSPESTSVKGGTITGNVGAVGNLLVGESGSVQLNGEVATCANLTINNGSTITGTAEVKGKVAITNANGKTAIVGSGAKYTSQSTTEGSRVALWVAGNNTGSTWQDIWDYSFQNNSPGGLIQGGAVAPLIPANQNNSYANWTTSGTNYSCKTQTQSSIVSGFTSPLFALCSSSSSTATAVPAQDISALCSSSNPSYSVDSGNTRYLPAGKYGTVTLNGGKLTLNGPGVYTFYNLTLNAGSTIDFLKTTTGVYYINICNSWNPSSNFNVTFSDTSYDATTVDYTQIRWYYDGATPVTVNSGTTGFAGVVTAPNAAITVHPGKSINGMIHAKSVYMDQGAIAPVSGPDPCNAVKCVDTETLLLDQVYTGACPAGSLPYWTYLTWDTTIDAQDANAFVYFEIVRGDTEAAVKAATNASFATLYPVAAYDNDPAWNTLKCPVAGVNNCPVSLIDNKRDYYNVIRLRAWAYYKCLKKPIAVNGWNVFYTCRDAL
jgi:cytoskeletal protein CcmA (bactofilin family)